MKYISTILIISLLYLGCKSYYAPDTSEETPPNIVFIMSDDHAVSAVSAYKDWLSDVAPTPNIDRIAKEGMLLNATYNTNSICGPSRAAILTGKYSHVNGFFKNFIVPFSANNNVIVLADSYCD